MSTSSTSSEEDLSLFQSVAVSAADIAESARKEAEKVEARRRSSNICRSSSTVQQQPPAGPDAATPSTAAAGATADGTPAPHRSAYGQDDKCELDITSKRIAAALDCILARQLEDVAPQPTQQQQPAAAAATAPASKAAAADHDAGDAAGVRLFKRVAPGTPCVIRSHTEYGSSASIYSLQPPGAAESGANHLHPLFAGQQRPFRSVREIIPRFNLAETSIISNCNKRHADLMDTLAVDGSVLLAAAVAAKDSAWKQLQQMQEQQQQQQSEGGKKKKKKKSGLATHAALEAWKHMRKHKVDGVVVEAKQFVPHEVRMTALLGGTGIAANR